MNNQESIDEEGVSLQELFRVIKKNFVLICLIVLLSGVAGFIYSKSIAKEKFQSDAKIAVAVESESDRIDFTYSVRVLYTYKDILMSDSVLKTVENKYNKSGSLSVTVPNDSLVLTIRYTCDDSDVAQKMLEDIISTSKLLIEKNFTNLLKLDNIQEVDSPRAAIKVSPNLMLNILMFAFIGGLVICAIIIFKEILNNTVKSDEELEYLTKINVLAEIPDKKMNGGVFSEKGR